MIRLILTDPASRAGSAFQLFAQTQTLLAYHFTELLELELGPSLSRCSSQGNITANTPPRNLNFTAQPMKSHKSHRHKQVREANHNIIITDALAVRGTWSYCVSDSDTPSTTNIKTSQP